MSKPTLSQHLKHLTQSNMIMRRVEDVQKVSYEVNHKRFENFEETARTIRIQMFMIEENEAFNSASLDQQIDKAFETMILRNLHQLKAQIEFESYPKLTLKKSMELTLLASPLFMHYENWLVAKCVKDKEYREKVLQKIDALIKNVEDLGRPKSNEITKTR